MSENLTHEANNVAIDPDKVLAYVIKQDDGYHVEDLDGNIGDVCKITKDGLSIALTQNAANRQWLLVNKADKFFVNGDEKMGLTYKATKVIGSSGPSIPNAGIIKYLNEADQAEFNAIVARAKDAQAAEKAKPKTELEKAQARLAKAEANLLKLQAAADVAEEG